MWSSVACGHGVVPGGDGRCPVCRHEEIREWGWLHVGGLATVRDVPELGLSSRGERLELLSLLRDENGYYNGLARVRPVDGELPRPVFDLPADFLLAVVAAEALG